MSSCDDRIRKALNIAFIFSQEEENKLWVIDQIVRTLCGTEEEYKNFVKTYETPLPNGKKYEWNTGNSQEEDESEEE